MSALDTVVLTAEELELLGHKIANKQSILKQDWSKLTAKPKPSGETDAEVQNEKRRLNDLLKEKERQIESLQAQLHAPVHQHQQQPTEANQVQQRVMQEQICKLSVQNGELEKKIKRLETLVEEKEGEKANFAKLIKDLERENEQLKREEIVHVEPTNGEREQLENLQKEISELKNATKQNEENQRQRLIEVLPENLRGDVMHDEQWVSSYRNVLGTHFESNKVRTVRSSKLTKVRVRIPRRSFLL